jgi:4-hydroxyproline epimerase
MFEPRGHDAMSGAILYPPLRADCDLAILYIEVTGCLPMCGHGTIGSVTFALEHGLVTPREEGVVALDAPAGKVTARFVRNGAHIDSVRLYNVPSYLAVAEVPVAIDGLGELVVDIAYGGNFYAIVDAQEHFSKLDDFSADQLISYSRVMRCRINEAHTFVHPENPTIHSCTHILWTGQTIHPDATARNAVFYGDKAIDRSPCGTGTSARMAQWFAKGKLKVGDKFIHESIIGSRFTGTVEKAVSVAGKPAIIPSIEGWAKVYGYNTITIDPDDDPYAFGFQVL